jgi:glycosyltransferase involved in cell wall biosynthesis
MPNIPLNLTNITALVVNYRTIDLIERCATSLLQHYPKVRLLLIDNGSQDDSTDYIRDMRKKHSNVQGLLLPQNIYHGPAMDLGIRTISTRYAFTLDSDCEVLDGGFLEQMLPLFRDPILYAAGSLSFKNRYGFSIRSEMKYYVRYINPHAMLVDIKKYRQLKPFFHHGAPCIKNMKDAERSGFVVQDFPIQDFIRHEGRGTCSRYGYNLGPMTLVQYFLTDYLPNRLALHK